MLSLQGRLLAVSCALIAGAPAIFGQSAVRINEVLADNVSLLAGDGSISDWVELVNPTGAAISLAGASLSNDDLIPDKWVFPPGSSIPGNSALIIACDQERAPSAAAGPFLNTGFSLSAKGGGIFFYGANFGPLIDSVHYGVQVGDLSVGKVGGVWKLCNPTPGLGNSAAALGSPSGLRINEWLANTSGDDWFEVYNTGALPVSMEGLYFTDKLTDKTKWPVPALSFIGSSLEGFVKFIADGNTENGPDHAGFSFNKDGEAIGVYDGLGTLLDGVTFGPQAPETSEGFLPDGSAFRTTFLGTASPGEPNYKEYPGLVVSELLSHTDPPLEDAVEFYNTSEAPIDISGWFLSNKKSDLKRYQIPPNTVILPHKFKVIYENDFNLTNPRTPFTFNSAHGDQVYLAEADSEGRLTGYRVGEDFESAENGVSFGRVETSVLGVHQFVAMARRTFGVDEVNSLEEFRTGIGASNSAPKIGPIVLNEMMYHPQSADGTDNRLDEFIELYNTTSTNVPLYDVDHPENTWRLQNGVSFSFPPNIVLPPFGYALVVSFDPNNDLIAASNFKTKFQVPGIVELYGPFRGDLNNDGDSLELYKPDPPQIPPHPDAGYVPYIRVDKVNYIDHAPWPTGGDGDGFSLQRKSAAAFGNDPVNWEPGAPTPGAGNSEAVRDTDGDGLPDVWEDLHQFDKNNPADAAIDTDQDGFTNLQEYIAGTDPRLPGSFLHVTAVVPVQGTNALQLSFTAAANKSYSVMYRNSLGITSTWQPLENIPAQSTEHTVTVQDAGAVDRTDRYYQIVTPAAN